MLQCFSHRIIALSRLEKTFRTTKSNPQSKLLSPITKQCPEVPHCQVSYTPLWMRSAPLLWAAHSNA